MKFKGVEYFIKDFVELWDVNMTSKNIAMIKRIVQVPSYNEKLPFAEV